MSIFMKKFFSDCIINIFSCSKRGALFVEFAVLLAFVCALLAVINLDDSSIVKVAKPMALTLKENANSGNLVVEDGNGETSDSGNTGSNENTGDSTGGEGGDGNSGGSESAGGNNSNEDVVKLDFSNTNAINFADLGVDVLHNKKWSNGGTLDFTGDYINYYAYESLIVLEPGEYRIYTSQEGLTDLEKQIWNNLFVNYCFYDDGNMGNGSSPLGDKYISFNEFSYNPGWIRDYVTFNVSKDSTIGLNFKIWDTVMKTNNFSEEDVTRTINKSFNMEKIR